MSERHKFFRINYNVLILVCILLLLAVMTPILLSSKASASSSIVINELVYNPQSGNQDDEFLELHNTSGSAVDISNWCFTQGISLCFASGTSINANSYLIISPNSSQTLVTYGITPVATYLGNLSNGGETITLLDSSSVEVDSITYDDSSPWPSSPDGQGPSLELNNPFEDNSLPALWSASLSSGGTPNAENSVLNVDLPEISDTTRPKIVSQNNAVSITARIENSTDVSLIYRVMFGSETTLTMYDDGVHGDADANDSIFGATIPIQNPGTLVRFKVQATNSDGTASAPSNDDSFNYYPYIVDDGQTSDLPIVRWYMDPVDYQDMSTNHITDDQKFSAIVAVDDQIFDNAKVRIKGASSTNFPKRKFKFDLPNGYTLNPPIFEHPVDEFAIQVYFLNLSDLQEKLAWSAFDQFGVTGLQNRYVRAQRNSISSNSEFIGHYLLIEYYDNLWRNRTDHESGALYKEGTDKKTRENEDHSDIQSLVNNVTTLQNDELKNYLMDNLNIPAIVNYHAISAVLSSDDWTFYKNIYQYRDTEGTGRWRYLPWDLDNAFVPYLFENPGGAEYLKYPIAGEFKEIYSGDGAYYDNAIIEKALYQFPEFREMFFRRSMNIYDQLWGNDKATQWFDELYSTSLADMRDDYTLWNPYRKAVFETIFPGGWPFIVPDDFPYGMNESNFMDFYENQTPEMTRTVFLYGANRYKASVATARSHGELLQPQTHSDETKIQITEIHYNPADNNQDLEFIELYNSSDSPVDLSNWRIDELDYTFDAGAVLPAHHYGVVVRNDVAFRAQYPSTFVLGQYAGNLSNSIMTLKLYNSSNQLISNVANGSDTPLLTSANGGGLSLNLLHPNANESLAECWVSRNEGGGTPGQVNNVNEYQPSSNINCTDRIHMSNQTATDEQTTMNTEVSNNTNPTRSDKRMIRLIALSIIIVILPSFLLTHHFANAKIKQKEG